MSAYLFQSTLPRRERRRVGFEILVLLPISIHAPAKGATDLKMMAYKRYHDFNPRSREGSDGMTLEELGNRIDISIHAPAKGATTNLILVSRTTHISIHAPAKGATTS